MDLEATYVHSASDELRAENHRLRGLVAQAEQDLKLAYIRNRPLSVFHGASSRTLVSGEVDDAAIVRRIMRAYRAAIQAPMERSESFWLVQIAALRKPEHDTLIGGDVGRVQAMLRDPQSNNLLAGFDLLAKNQAPDDAYRDLQGRLCYDLLVRLAEAVGVVRLESPESNAPATPLPTEELLSRLDDAFGFQIDFPNPYSGEIGLLTQRGTASYRALQSLHQAYCIGRLAPRGKVVEIGGGLGRTAYYAARLGLAEYAIVDLPLTGAAQAYFLHRAGLPVCLYREDASAGIRLLPPAEFLGASDPFDLCFNADGFTGMGPETVRQYIAAAARRSHRMLSINHECGPVRVRDIARQDPRILSSTREPYWLRRGYVHELSEFQPSAGRPAEAAPAQLDARSAYLRFHPLEAWNGVAGTTAEPSAPDDEAIVRRIAASYQAATGTPVGATESAWLEQFAELKRPEHETMTSGDLPSMQAMLRNPRSNNLFYGFDNLVSGIVLPDSWPEVQARQCYDSLLTLCEALGTVRLDNPEAPGHVTLTTPVEHLLAGLDAAMGKRIVFPNPFPGEVGLATSRGLASYRAIQAIYQGWLVAQAAPDGTVLEIGGGLGRTAYYARSFGVREYAIVDIPLTGVAQAYFLHRVGESVQLYGEPGRGATRIMPPVTFFESDEGYDLILNVDSFTEMAADTMTDYFDEATRRTPQLLSINHEVNNHRLFDLARRHNAVRSATRHPYWLRRGYVQEEIVFHPT